MNEGAFNGDARSEDSPLEGNLDEAELLNDDEEEFWEPSYPGDKKRAKQPGEGRYFGDDQDMDAIEQSQDDEVNRPVFEPGQRVKILSTLATGSEYGNIVSDEGDGDYLIKVDNMLKPISFNWNELESEDGNQSYELGHGPEITDMD